MAMSKKDREKYSLSDPGKDREWILQKGDGVLAAVLFDNNKMAAVSNVDLTDRVPPEELPKKRASLKSDPSVRQFQSAPPGGPPAKPVGLKSDPSVKQFQSAPPLPPARRPTMASEVVPRTPSPVAEGHDRFGKPQSPPPTKSAMEQWIQSQPAPAPNLPAKEGRARMGMIPPGLDSIAGGSPLSSTYEEWMGVTPSPLEGVAPEDRMKALLPNPVSVPQALQKSLPQAPEQAPLKSDPSVKQFPSAPPGGPPAKSAGAALQSTPQGQFQRPPEPQPVPRPVQPPSQDAPDNSFAEFPPIADLEGMEPPERPVPVQSSVAPAEAFEPADEEVSDIEVVQPVPNQVKAELGPVPEPPPEREELPQARTEEEAVEAEPTISDTVTAIQRKTKEDLGPFVSPEGEVIVTVESLLEHSKKGKSAKNRILINPNTNTAVVVNAEGDTLDSFSVGSGDTTGVQYGQKYFSPVGSWKIVNQVPYAQVEDSYGPMWMGIDAKGYGLHGPHKASDKAEGGGFKNGGFVSHGCLRFTEEDITRLSSLLDVGSSVDIMPYDTRPNHTGPLRVEAE